MTSPRARSREDAISFVYEPPRSSARRILFEPRSDGLFERREAEWDDGQWREAGSEIVELHDIEVPERTER